MFGADEDYIGIDPELPGKATSVWIDTTPKTKYPIPRIKDIEVDVVIVGGGIAGLTTAFLLKEAGKSVAVIEARKIVDDVTGHTTAKVTSQHGLIYKFLIDNFGLENARIYAKANESAIKLIEVIAQENGIKCDFTRTPAYIYTESPAYLKDIKEEVEASKEVGLKASYVEETELSMPIIGAIKVENQAQFHPRKYLLGLAELIPGANSYVFESTRVLDIEENERCTVKTEHGDITASQVVVATNFPIYDKGSFFTKLYPIRSYVLGVRVEGKVPLGLYYSVEKDNYHSVRSQVTKDGFVLIINGEEHKAGQADNTEDYYKRLINYAKANFKVKDILYHWSTQDNHTPDRIPYIGLSPKSKNIYLATGFNGWGMTSGTVSAIIIAEEILGKKNPWAEFFSPERKGRVSKGTSSFISENFNVATQYVKKAVSRETLEFVTDIVEGEGKVTEYGGKKVALYKDEKGEIHMVSPTCTHLGCQVNWNQAEKTWDCPCHGSRYAANGEVIHSPAIQPLKNEDTRPEETKE